VRYSNQYAQAVVAVNAQQIKNYNVVLALTAAKLCAKKWCSNMRCTVLILTGVHE
jgi:hypothetical protein